MALPSEYLLAFDIIGVGPEVNEVRRTFGFNPKADDPVTKLAPAKVAQALHGTLDDFYPQTTRILHQY
jgi:hypothetical protein